MSAAALISSADFVVFVSIRVRRKAMSRPGTAVANLATFLPNSFVFHMPVISLFIHQEWVFVFHISLNISYYFAKSVGKFCDERGIFQSRANVLTFTTGWQLLRRATGSNVRVRRQKACVFIHNKHKKTPKAQENEQKAIFYGTKLPLTQFWFYKRRPDWKSHNISRRGCYVWLP